MTGWNRPAGSGRLCAIALLTLALPVLSNCQNGPAASSSETQRVAETVAEDERAVLCRLLRPVPLPAWAFDALPRNVQDELIIKAEIWDRECGDLAP